MEMDPILNSIGHAKLAPAGKIYIGKPIDKKEYNIDVNAAKQMIAEGNIQSINDAISVKSVSKIDISQFKSSVKNGSETEAATLELSSTKVIEKEQSVKVSGSSSPRESWENDALKMRNEKQPSVKNSDDRLEMMRFDAPDIYARYMELWQKASDCHVHREVNVYKWINDYEIDVEKYDDVDEETVRNLRETYKGNCAALYTYDHSPESYKKAEPYIIEASKLLIQWERDRCMSSGLFKAPTTKQFTAMDALSKTYSDGAHDTSINFYSKDEDTKPYNIYSGASLWKYSTKFNLLLTTDILNSIATGNKTTASSWMRRIDDVVKNMKDIEKAYQGSHSYLRFGAIFNGEKVTYHANWAGCDNKHGVEADSPEGLLKIISN